MTIRDGAAGTKSEGAAQLSPLPWWQEFRMALMKKHLGRKCYGCSAFVQISQL